MPDFSKLFKGKREKPVIYRRKRILLLDRFPIQPKVEMSLGYRIISTNSEWKQGFGIYTEGRISFGEEEEIKNGWFWIWEHQSPNEDVFECKSKIGVIEVINIWDTGDGSIESGHFGAAMWVENIPNGRRYHCNDGHPDDNFDDIVFEIFFVK